MNHQNSINPDLINSLERLIIFNESNYCTHEEALYRGGSIWTICRDCGKQWADDTGGVPKDVHEYHEVIKNARKVLEAVKVRK